MNKLRITTLASGVDGAIRRISTVYDVSGNVKSVTSYDNAAVNSGNVVNQVLYEYDANGLLAKDFSNPSGGVLASTPYIGYTYDTTKSGDQFTKRLRLTVMKYPGGKTLNYGYGTANSDGDKLNRLTEIKDGTTSVVQYVSEGVATPMKITYPQPGLALDYTASGTLDRFGRIADHAWKKSTTDVVRIKHGYDRVGNRTYRNDSVQTSNSELYGYDGVNQIKSLNRGVLNSANTSVTTSNFTESWNYDGTGNWLQYNRASVVENRTHNKANEVQTSCTHDRNGSMTVMPGLKGKYDAWNRLVEVRNSSDSLLAAYGYNGLNHRVKKTVGSVVTTSYFNQQWQELESVTSGQTTSYVWGSRYIDDLVYRDMSSERLYALADPNWNVVALTNASGTVQERMKYDAFGKVTWMNASFTTKANSDYAWTRTFTCQVLDTETGLMLYRNRYYHAGLGRFVSRDPIGYRGSDTNVYEYVGNMPYTYLDPHGYFFVPGTQLFADCVRTCEDSCYNIFMNRRWYPGQYYQFVACVAACPSSCRDQDFTFCNYLNNWPTCYKDALKCAGFMAEIADTGANYVPEPIGKWVSAVTDGLDCALDLVTMMQFYCKSNKKNKLSEDTGFMAQLMIAIGDCGLGLIQATFRDPTGNAGALLDAYFAALEEANLIQNDGGASVKACRDFFCKCDNILQWR